jgi:hypothetical protein
VFFLHLLDYLGVVGIGAAISSYHSKSTTQKALVEKLDAPVGSAGFSVGFRWFGLLSRFGFGSAPFV